MSTPGITERFRAQHADIEQRANAILAQITRGTWTADIAAFSAEFSQFTAKLRIHLALEDNALYPRLADHNNQDLQTLARQYQREMSGLRDRYEGFVTEWLHSDRLSRSPAEFASETKLLFAALHERLKREDTQLYPLADSLV